MRREEMELRIGYAMDLLEDALKVMTTTQLVRLVGRALKHLEAVMGDEDDGTTTR